MHGWNEKFFRKAHQAMQVRLFRVFRVQDKIFASLRLIMFPIALRSLAPYGERVGVRGHIQLSTPRVVAMAVSIAASV